MLSPQGLRRWRTEDPCLDRLWPGGFRSRCQPAAQARDLIVQLCEYGLHLDAFEVALPEELL